jgi:murein L,D-transpeptidase YcbB/YkuD
VLLAPPAAGQEGSPQTVRAIISRAQHPWARRPGFARDAEAVRRLYEPRAGAPLWLDAGRPSPAALAAIVQLLGAPELGLDPGDYDAALLDSVAGRIPELSPEERAHFDVLLTVDLVRFFGDVQQGRVRNHPLSVRSGLAVPEPALLVERALAGDSVARLVRGIEPELAQYRLLRTALARYRTLAADTSLAGLPAQFVWPGSSYDSLTRLSRILVALGDLSPDSVPTGTAYQGPVVAAVRHFQRRHALAPDGVLGPRTLAALDAPVGERVRAIELALERLRWVPPIGDRRFLVVNVPAFLLVGFDSAAAPGPPAIAMPVVVGYALDRRTPLLFEQLRYVEFLPYWNVPRSILAGEIVPMLEWNPGYLRSHDMELVGRGDRVLGDSVTPAVLRRLRRGELRVRQRPGPYNALGLVKFIFPNSNNVYLHDTPRKELFDEAERDFSHGCISVADPAALAEWVLRDRPEWTRDTVEAALAGTRTLRVLLREPMPVLVFYTTAVARGDGSVWFYPDIYGLDRELTDALDGRRGDGPPASTH